MTARVAAQATSRVEREFHTFWGAQAVSVLGDQISLVAIPLLAVAGLHASVAQMGLLTAAGQAPLLVFGLLAGAWVDRVRRRRLLVAADLARAGVLATIPVTAATGLLGIPLLAAVVFAAASCGVVFNTAAVAYLPSVLRPERLVPGNARLTQIRAVAQIAGPGAGGALVQALTAPVAILLDAVSFVGSAVLLSRIRLAEPRPAPARDSVRRQVLAGLTLVRRSPLLRASAGSAGTYTFFQSAVLAICVLYLSRHLHLAPGEIGLVLAAAGPGGLAGAALAARASRRFGVGPVMIAGLAVAGAANLVLPLAQPLAAGPPGAGPPGSGAHAVLLAVLLAGMAVNGFGQPFYNINQSSLRQAVVPVALRGRVTATMTVLAGCAAPVGGLAAGLAGGALGVRSALLVAALGTALAFLWPLASPVRRLRTLPAGPEP